MNSYQPINQRAHGRATGAAMSTKSTPSAVPKAAAQSSSHNPPANSGQKAAATARRHKEERRAESLHQIKVQTADGTLVVSQMTTAQHEAASETARETFARNQARGKRYKSPSTREQSLGNAPDVTDVPDEAA
jgi:hypothetical protein